MSERKHRHSQSDRGLDLYQTDPVAVESLVRYEELPPRLWDASCGPGNILRVLRSHGYETLGTDIAHYGSPYQDFGGGDFDFLQLAAPPRPVDGVVQNPPFYVKDAFVEKSMELVRHGYFLMPLTWLESDGRADLFARGMLKRVLVFSNRLPFMHREGWTGNKSSSTTAYAWFVFDREFRGFPEIRWIRWK